MSGLRLVVVDLDGTLCNSAHRDHHAQAGDWEAYHSTLPLDPPHGDVAALVELISAARDALGAEVFLLACTGRPERHRQATLQWMIKHNLMLDYLLMRADEDRRSDAQAKPQALMDWWASTAGDVLGVRAPDDRRTAQEATLFVLEDRRKMVEAWRSLGFCCWQVRDRTY